MKHSVQNHAFTRAITLDTPLSHAALLLASSESSKTKGFKERSLPVISRGRLVGILTANDTFHFQRQWSSSKLKSKKIAQPLAVHAITSRFSEAFAYQIPHYYTLSKLGKLQAIVQIFLEKKAEAICLYSSPGENGAPKLVTRAELLNLLLGILQNLKAQNSETHFIDFKLPFSLL